jgi:3-methyl-2-oxobutanoate hydroxymethyltransferase
MERKPASLPSLFKKVAEKQQLSMLTCYDFPTAVMQDRAGIDIILVGDSLGMTMLGYESTLPVTMEDMIRHAQAVRRGSPNAWLIGDMPYMTYQPSIESAIRNAGRFMAEAGCNAVKLEGGVEMADRIAALVRSGIPTMGHLGLTPQSAGAQGGFRLQGKGAVQAKKIVDDAKILEEAGAYSILIELVPHQVCKIITERAQNCFIIGLGSGPDAHGQVLIYHDMFGLFPRFRPKMARLFADAGKVIQQGLEQYVKEVTERTFPQPENWFQMPDEEYQHFMELLKK